MNLLDALPGASVDYFKIRIFTVPIGVRAIFCQGGGGGAIIPLPKKLFQVAQNFTKQSRGN